MDPDLRIALSLAALLFACLTSVVTSGVVVVPPRAASEVRRSRWRWAPVVTLGAAVVGAALLPWWPGWLAAVVAALLAGVAVSLRPVSAPAWSSGRRAAAVRDGRERRRMVLWGVAQVVLAVGVCGALVASQG